MPQWEKWLTSVVLRLYRCLRSSVVRCSINPLVVGELFPPPDNLRPVMSDIAPFCNESTSSCVELIQRCNFHHRYVISLVRKLFFAASIRRIFKSLNFPDGLPFTSLKAILDHRGTDGDAPTKRPYFRAASVAVLVLVVRFLVTRFQHRVCLWGNFAWLRD